MDCVIGMKVWLCDVCVVTVTLNEGLCNVSDCCNACDEGLGKVCYVYYGEGQPVP